MSLRNARDVHRSVLSSLLDGPVSGSAKHTAAQVEHYVTSSKSMMLVTPTLACNTSFNCLVSGAILTQYEGRTAVAERHC